MFLVFDGPNPVRGGGGGGTTRYLLPGRASRRGIQAQLPAGGFTRRAPATPAFNPGAANPARGGRGGLNAAQAASFRAARRLIG